MTYLQRKKLAFMSIVNKVKGFVRTISGVPPLTLPNCVDAESMIDYTVEGASGGVGDLTENLFDNAKNWSGIGNSSIPSYGDDFVQKLDGGGYHIGSHSSASFTVNNLVAGEKYTLSYLLTADDFGTTVNMIYVGSSATYEYAYSKGQRVRVTKKFTAGDTGSITFKFGISNLDKGWGHYYGGTITELMLVKGSTAKAYEPYGYKIPIVCSGKNMLNLPYTTDNRLVSARDSKAVFSFKVEIGKTYTFSLKNYLPTANGTRLAWCLSYVDKYDNWAGNPEHIHVAVWDVRQRTFTATKDTVYFIPGVTQGTIDGVWNGTNEHWDFQLEEGSIKTTYEKGVAPITTNIYLDAPLEDGESINLKEDNLPILPTVQGTTIYTVDTEVQPNMEVTYYSTQKG